MRLLLASSTPAAASSRRNCCTAAAAAASAAAGEAPASSRARGKFGERNNSGSGGMRGVGNGTFSSSSSFSSPPPSSSSPSTRRRGRDTFNSSDRRRETSDGRRNFGERAFGSDAIRGGGGGGLNPSSLSPTPTSTSNSTSSAAAAAAAAKAAGLGQFEPPWTKQDEEAVRAASASSCSTTAATASSSSSSDASSSSPPPPLILLSMSEEELRRLAVEDGEGAYRGKQAYDSITKGASTLDDIRGIPRAWRDKLAARGAVVGRADVFSTAASSDGTLKLLLKLSDGHVVETVGIPSRDGARLTVCVSSQVGCPMRCSFCATGKGGYARNLTTAEIVGQVIAVRCAFEERAARQSSQQQANSASSSPKHRPRQQPIPSRVSNVVFMGMGEPALNLRAVLPALREINARLGVGARKVTLSTVGVPNTIATRIAAENLQFTLAVSLHAPTQELRERLVPSARAYPLDALLRDCVAYEESSGGGRRVTFEYALLSGVNDSQAHAAQLARLLKKYNLRSHVNLIPFNPISNDDGGGGGISFAAPPRAVAAAFEATLAAAGIPASVRASRGRDAAAACGQLRNEHQRRGAALVVEAAAVA